MKKDIGFKLFKNSKQNKRRKQKVTNDQNNDYVSFIHFFIKIEKIYLLNKRKILLLIALLFPVN